MDGIVLAALIDDAVERVIPCRAVHGEVVGGEVEGRGVIEHQCFNPSARAEMIRQRDAARVRSVVDIDHQIIDTHTGEADIGYINPGTKDDLVIRAVGIDEGVPAVAAVIIISVIAVMPDEQVRIRAAVEYIVSVGAVKIIIAGTAVERIVSAVALNHIILAAACQHIIARRAGERKGDNFGEQAFLDAFKIQRHIAAGDCVIDGGLRGAVEVLDADHVFDQADGVLPEGFPRGGIDKARGGGFQTIQHSSINTRDAIEAVRCDVVIKITREQRASFRLRGERCKNMVERHLERDRQVRPRMLRRIGIDAVLQKRLTCHCFQKRKLPRIHKPFTAVGVDFFLRQL